MFDLPIRICWLFFVIFWISSSMGVKKNKQENNRLALFSSRFMIITATVIFIFNITPLRHFLYYPILPPGIVVQTIGLVICALGITFAIWARVHLGKNWGMPMVIKENPDIVVTGPYYFIRHPIYTGILIAMLGSMVFAGLLWFIWFFLFFVSFIYSAKKEEKLMLLQFSAEYRDYMKRTKMFIPFIY